jgi:outer membrane immunogenic protein
MRWVICAVVVLALAPSAFAGDFDMLRGSQSVGPATFTNWSGFYIGGQVGYSGGKADFSNSTSPPIAYSLRNTFLENNITPSNWLVLGTANHDGSQFGGYVGYSTQWQDLILGLEGNVNRSSLSLNAPSTPIARLTPADSNGNTYAVVISGNGTVTNLDYGTLRARAGWIMGNFLPYGFAGLAVGRADVNIKATVAGEQNPPAIGSCASSPTCVPFAFTSTSGKDGSWLYGFTVGAGIDVAVTRNIFLRAEYEYVQFAPVANVLLDINSVHVGAGVKF